MNGTSIGVFQLRIVAIGVFAYAAERELGKRLPTFCPDRHQYADGYFCLGLRPHSIVSVEAASRWWFDLQNYLFLQIVAGQTGLWPTSMGLSHGQAAFSEIAARQAAASIGIESLYDDMIAGESNWLTSVFESTNSSNGSLPKKWRATQLLPHRAGRPKEIRRAVQTIVLAERKRRKMLSEFWKKIRQGGHVCCRTMRSCPLND